MKFKLIYLCIAGLFYLGTNASFAQDNSRFFDEGKLPEKPNAIKLDALSAINGEISVHYERAITHYLTIEVGAGILTSRYDPGSIFFISNELSGEVDSGFAWSVFPRYYIGGSAMESYYVGIQYKNTQFDQMDRSLTQQATTLNYGRQWKPTESILIDFYGGIGFYSEDPANPAVSENTTGTALQGGIRLVKRF